MTKNAPAMGRATFRSWVAPYRRKKPKAKIMDARPVYQSLSSIRRFETKRMYPKIAASTTAAIPAIARRTVVESWGNAGGLGGAGGGIGSMVSALDRLPALRAELHVAGNFVAVGAQ